MTPGELVKSARQKHGLTQRQLATRARTSQAAISRIERDLVSPSVATLAELLAMMDEELVLDAREIDWGHDRSLIQANLAQTADKRFRRGVAFSRFVKELQGARARGGL